MGEKMRKVTVYKGFVIAEDVNETTSYQYHAFTKDEWGYGADCRYPEWQADSIEECKEWIDSY